MSKSSGISVLTPDIVCDRDTWSKLIAYSMCTVQMPKFSGKGVQRSRIEISGVGIVVQEDSRTFRIKDFLLIPSEGSGATTEFINEGLVAVVEEIMTNGNPEDVANMRMWWHTHPTGNLSWSRQDTDTMEDFGYKSGYPWLLSIVTDGSGRYRCRLDIFEAMGGNFRTYFDNLTIDIQDSEIIEMLPTLQAEVDDKVKTKSYQVPARRLGYHAHPNKGYGKTSPREAGYLAALLGEDEPTDQEMQEFEDYIRGRLDGHDLEEQEQLRLIERREEAEQDEAH